MNSPVEQRLEKLMTSQLFAFAAESARRHRTDDLVIILDMTEDEPELIASTREDMTTSPMLSESMRSKLSKPAASVLKTLRTPQQSFWLLAIHSDNQMDCVAINASMLAPGGTA